MCNSIPLLNLCNHTFFHNNNSNFCYSINCNNNDRHSKSINNILFCIRELKYFYQTYNFIIFKSSKDTNTCICCKYILQNRNMILKSLLQDNNKSWIQHNNMCGQHCRILTSLQDREEDSSTGATDNDSQYCCTASIADTQFLLEALCNQISDHHTFLDWGIYLRQHKRQVSKCRPCSKCSYSQRNSRLCLSNCRTTQIYRLQSSLMLLQGICSRSSGKPLRICHSKQIF